MKQWQARELDLMSNTGARDAVTVYASLLRGELEGDLALRAAHQMLELVMDSIPQAIFWKDTGLTYLGCNKVFADLAGMDPDEMIGKSDLDMPWANHEAGHFRGWDRHVIDTGEPEFGLVEEIRRRDGTTLTIETNKVPLRDGNGDVVGILGTFEDVTEKLHAEEELRQSLEALDERVRLRTEELSRANAILRREVDERVRLQAEERQQRSYAEALRETAAAISSSLELDVVLEEVLVGAERLLSHDLGAIVLLDGGAPDPDMVHYRARFGYGPGAGSTTGESLKLDVIDSLLTAGEDLRGRPQLLSVGRDREVQGLWRDARAVIAAPMTVGSQLIGFIIAESATSGLFDPSHLERLTTVADQAAAAISNAQLFETAAELAAVDERQRLARDLHDSVSQTLWTASLVAGSLADRSIDDVEIASQVNSIRTLTRGAVAEMRTLLLELRPRALAETPLRELLDQLVAGLESRKDLVVEAEFLDVDQISSETKLGLYRIAQEAFNNIGRHSTAAKVRAQLDRTAHQVTVKIEDNGQGFAVEDTPPDRLGLSIMRERAAAIDAVLEVCSAPGEGTTIEVCAPLFPGQG